MGLRNLEHGAENIQDKGEAKLNPLQIEALGTLMNNGSRTDDNASTRRDSLHVVATGDNPWSIAKRSLQSGGETDLSPARIQNEILRIGKLNADTCPEFLSRPKELQIGTPLKLGQGPTESPAGKTAVSDDTSHRTPRALQGENTEPPENKNRKVDFKLDNDGKYTIKEGEGLADIAYNSLARSGFTDINDRAVRHEMQRLADLNRSALPDGHHGKLRAQPGDKLQVVPPDRLESYRELKELVESTSAAVSTDALECENRPITWKDAPTDKSTNVRECEKVVLPFNARAHIWKGGEAIAKYGSTYIAYPGSRVTATSGSFGVVFPGASIKEYPGALMMPAKLPDEKGKQ